MTRLTISRPRQRGWRAECVAKDSIDAYPRRIISVSAGQAMACLFRRAITVLKEHRAVSRGLGRARPAYGASLLVRLFLCS